MIEDIAWHWMEIGSVRHTSMSETHIFAHNSVIAEISLARAVVPPLPPPSTLLTCIKLWVDGATGLLTRYDDALTAPNVISLDDAALINFWLEVENAYAYATALIFFRSTPQQPQPPTPQKIEREVATYVVHDRRTGEILHTHRVLAFPGATIPSIAKVEEEALDSASKVYGKPLSGLSALRVQKEDLKPGVQYKVDMRTRKLVVEKLWRR